MDDRVTARLQPDVAVVRGLESLGDVRLRVGKIGFDVFERRRPVGFESEQIVAAAVTFYALSLLQ